MTSRPSKYRSSRDIDTDDYERSAKRRRDDRSSYDGSGAPMIDPQYRTLCLSHFNSHVKDDDLLDAVYCEFKKFGELTVKILYNSGNRRLVYVYYRYPEDAKAAKQALQDKLVLFDSPIHIDPVYSTKSPRSGRRSASPVEPAPSGRDRDGYRRASPPPTSSRVVTREGNGNYGGVREYYDKKPSRDVVYGTTQQRPAQVGPEDDETATRTLFVGNLDQDITPDDLHAVFDRFGYVDDVDVKRATAGAFAFVRFFHLDMAYRAKCEMSGRMIKNHACRIGYGKAVPSNCVWVGGIGPWVTPDILAREFGRYGLVQRVDWPPDRNFAYVTYSGVDDARCAVAAMRGFPLGGPERRLRVDFADISQIALAANLPRDSGRAEDYPPSARPWPEPDRRGPYDEQRRAHGDRSASPDSHRFPDNLQDLDATTIAELARKLPVVWSGTLMLKNSAFATKLHLINGEMRLINSLLRDTADADSKMLKITQRLRLDDAKLGEVRRRIVLAGPGGCSMLLALPTADVPVPSDIQQRPLKNLVAYLRQKDAAGVVLLPPGSGGAGSGVGRTSHHDSGLLHAFPPCEFARQQLSQRAPRLSNEQTNEDYLVVLLVRVTQ